MSRSGYVWDNAATESFFSSSFELRPKTQAQIATEAGYVKVICFR